MNQALKQFDERRFDGRRRFELFSDSVVVSGSSAFGTRFEERVDLEPLSAQPARLWTRHPGFWAGVGMAITFWMLAMGFANVLSPFWKGLFWVWAAAGLLLAVVTARRIEWAIFHNSSGIRVLTVARAGPDKDRFEEFVTAVRDAITDRKRKHVGADT